MASQSILDIVRAVTGRIGLERPGSATGSSDNQVQQLVALANEEGQELADRYPWQALIREKTFTTVAAESQGLLVGGTILTPADGFKYIVNDTVWDRSMQYQLQASSPARWQADKGFTTVGPYARFRIRAGVLLLNPAPGAGQSLAFEYMSDNWVSNQAGDTFSPAFTQDADYPLLDSRLIAAGLLWRWKAAKGLEYAEDYNKYERMVLDATVRDGSKSAVSMNGPDNATFGPYVVVPSGNWNQ